MTKIYAAMGPAGQRYLPVEKEQTCLVRLEEKFFYYAIGESPYEDKKSTVGSAHFKSSPDVEQKIIKAGKIIILELLPPDVFARLRVNGKSEDPWLKFDKAISNDANLLGQLSGYWQKPSMDWLNVLRSQSMVRQSQLENTDQIISMAAELSRPVSPQQLSDSAKGKRKAMQPPVSPNRKKVKYVLELDRVGFFNDNQGSLASKPPSPGLGSVDPDGVFHPANSFSVIPGVRVMK